MRIAVIDMGTNTFHLMVVDVYFDSFSILHKEKAAVKIGKGGINEGFITNAAQDRALGTLRHFKSVIDSYHIEEIYATATSAIRNAKNGLDLTDLIQQITGIHTRIINGKEEAEYIYYGVTQALTIGEKPALIMDIGGGSIEFVIANDREIFWLQSFEIGGQRLLDKFHRNDPITASDITALNEHLSESLAELFNAYAQHHPTTLIGSSGTFDTLSAIYQQRTRDLPDPNAREHPFSFEAFEEIYQEIVSKDKAQRLLIPGMAEMRVDMIVVALVLVKFVLDALSLTDLRISAYALKEGVLLKTIDQLKESNKLKPNLS